MKKPRRTNSLIISYVSRAERPLTEAAHVTVEVLVSGFGVSGAVTNGVSVNALDQQIFRNFSDAFRVATTWAREHKLQEVVIVSEAAM